MDDVLFAWINGGAGHYAWIDMLMKHTTAYGPYVFAGILVLFLVSKRGRTEGVAGFVALLFAMGINYVIKSFYYRPRPFVQWSDDVNLLMDHAANSSFPSNHTTAAITIALVIWYYNRRMGRWLIGFALLMGVSRIYVGHHYPSDVFFGILFGLLSVIVILKAQSIWRALQMREHMPLTDIDRERSKN